MAAHEKNTSFIRGNWGQIGAGETTRVKHGFAPNFGDEVGLQIPRTQFKCGLRELKQKIVVTCVSVFIS